MKTNFTPGPWEIELVAGLPRVYSASAGRAVAIPCGLTVGELCGSRENQEETAANARLIAAAPRMFEALRRVADSRHEPDKWLMEVREALAKAEGQVSR